MLIVYITCYAMSFSGIPVKNKQLIWKIALKFDQEYIFYYTNIENM